MKKVIKTISLEEVLKIVDELCELIKNIDASICKSCVAEHACFQIITMAADTHYEGLGILQEVMLSWREESLNALNDECENEIETNK